MAMLKYGAAVVAEPSIGSDQWQKYRAKNACDFDQSRVKVAKTVLAKYSPEKYLLSHATIIAAVDTELADPNNPNSDYYIHPAYSQFVNNNGDAWSKKMLASCYKTFVGSNNFCFVAGTRVLMANGVYKPIELIQEGDRVINRKGEIAKVSRTFIRQTNNLIKLSGKNILSRNLFVTPEHPFWVYSARDTCPKTGRPNSFNSNKDFYHLNDWVGFSVGSHKAKDEKFECGIKPDWKNSADLNLERDFFTHPVPASEIANSEVNANRAELIGWFLAEGSYMSTNIFSKNESGVAFNMGNDELDIANKISDLLQEEFGEYFRVDCKPRIHESQTGNYVVYLSNKYVADYFKKWCGKYAWAKRLPEEALWLPKNLQALILKYCLNGDGCGTINSRGYLLELKSQPLIQQLLFISLRLGMLPVYKETGVLPRYTDCEKVDGFEIYIDPSTGKKSRPGYMLRYSVQDSKRLNDLLDYQDEKIANKKSKRKTHIFSHNESHYIVSKIGSVEKKEIASEVFNIEVEGDNSYIVEGVIVHNCEHVQIQELSKGKVIDAVLREVPVGKDKKGNDLTTYYVDILVATERKHKELVAQIESGEMNKMSMGCKIAYSICSKCGNKAVDDAEACEHVRFEKNNMFFDEYGVQRKVAELCGHYSAKDSVTFIDASWVKNPAFTGAVVRNIVNPPENVMAKIEEASKVENYKYSEGDFLKAAQVENYKYSEGDFLKAAQVKLSDETEDPPVEDSSPEEEPAVEDNAAPGEETAAPEESATPPEPALDQNSAQTWKKKIKDRLMRELGDEIVKELDEGSGNGGDRELETLDENLIQPTASTALKQMYKMKKSWNKYLENFQCLDKKKATKLKFGTYMVLTSNDLTTLADYGYNRRDFLAVMSFLDSCFKNPLSLGIKKAVAELGSTKGINLDTTIYALQKLSGRRLNASELERALTWLKAMDAYSE